MTRHSLVFAAALALLIAGVAAAAEINVVVTARPVSWTVAPGSFINAWTYNGSATMSETAIVILCIALCVFLSALVGNEIEQERRRSLRGGGDGCTHRRSN